MGMHERSLSLAGMVQRKESRRVDQRTEERHRDIFDQAVIFFRGREYPVAVVNISSRGTMVESDILPHIGESIVIRFQDCSRISAFVRWVREGRIGLNFGHEIVLSA